MDKWLQICDLRTSLLQLQFVHCSLAERVEQQRSRVQRAHRDRLIQYYSMWQEYQELERSNFKRIIILKLESCLDCYEGDGEAWQLLDQFTTLSRAIQQEMSENMSKLYIGKKILFDIGDVEQQLAAIETRILSFLQKYSQAIGTYGVELELINSTKNCFSGYLNEIRNAYGQIRDGYGAYLKRRLEMRSKEVDRSINKWKLAIYG